MKARFASWAADGMRKSHNADAKKTARRKACLSQRFGVVATAGVLLLLLLLLPCWLVSRSVGCSVGYWLVRYLAKTVGRWAVGGMSPVFRSADSL